MLFRRPDRREEIFSPRAKTRIIRLFGNDFIDGVSKLYSTLSKQRFGNDSQAFVTLIDRLNIEPSNDPGIKKRKAEDTRWITEVSEAVTAYRGHVPNTSNWEVMKWVDVIQTIISRVAPCLETAWNRITENMNHSMQYLQTAGLFRTSYDTYCKNKYCNEISEKTEAALRTILN